MPDTLLGRGTRCLTGRTGLPDPEAPRRLNVPLTEADEEKSKPLSLMVPQQNQGQGSFQKRSHWHYRVWGGGSSGVARKMRVCGYRCLGSRCPPGAGRAPAIRVLRPVCGKKVMGALSCFSVSQRPSGEHPQWVVFWVLDPLASTAGSEHTVALLQVQLHGGRCSQEEL